MAHTRTASKSRPPQVSRDEWMKALLVALERHPGSAEGAGMTIQEMSEATGMSIMPIRRRLQQLAREDRLSVMRTYRSAIDGVRRPVPVYSLKKLAD